MDNDTGPSPDDFRHIGLITPQGFDPLLTTPFRKMVETYGALPDGPDSLKSILRTTTRMRLFGVRYVISSEYSKQFPN